MASRYLQHLTLSEQSDGYYLVTGDSREEDETYMRLHFYQNGLDKGRTIVRVADHRCASFRPVKLTRGIYEVTIEKCLDVVRKDKWTPEESYGSRVMAGERYRVSVGLREAQVCGRLGVRVTVVSEELPLGDTDLFYRIRKPNPVISGIRYWVPMKQNTYLDFFVQGVRLGEIEFSERQNEILNITVRL